MATQKTCQMESAESNRDKAAKLLASTSTTGSKSTVWEGKTAVADERLVLKPAVAFSKVCPYLKSIFGSTHVILALTNGVYFQTFYVLGSPIKNKSTKILAWCHFMIHNMCAHGTIMAPPYFCNVGHVGQKATALETQQGPKRQEPEISLRLSQNVPKPSNRIPRTPRGRISVSGVPVLIRFDGFRTFWESL